MCRYIAIIFLGLITFSEYASAETELPPAIKTMLESVSPAAKIAGYRNGDLDNDGIEDFAFISSDNIDDQVSNQLFIFKGKADGSYEFFAKSKTFPLPQHGSPEFEIKHNSLYVNAFRSTPDSNDVVIYQFKYIDHGFLLVGDEEDLEYRNDDGDFDSKFKVYKISTNYLTGKRIEKQTIKGKTKLIKSQLEAESRELRKLEDFVF